MLYWNTCNHAASLTLALKVTKFASVMISALYLQSFAMVWKKLQAFPQVKLLVTSRMVAVLPCCDTLQLQKLQPGIAARLLKHACKDTITADQAHVLADHCGYHALYLTVVGGFISSGWCSAQVWTPSHCAKNIVFYWFDHHAAVKVS
jgi:hypothetical protein